MPGFTVLRCIRTAECVFVSLLDKPSICETSCLFLCLSARLFTSWQSWLTVSDRQMSPKVSRTNRKQSLKDKVKSVCPHKTIWLWHWNLSQASNRHILKFKHAILILCLDKKKETFVIQGENYTVNVILNTLMKSYCCLNLWWIIIQMNKTFNIIGFWMTAWCIGRLLV